MSRALSSCPCCGQALFQPFRPSMSSRGAPAQGRRWHSDTQSPTFAWSWPLLTKTKCWQPCGARVGAAPHRISQCRLGCWKPSPFPQPTPHGAAQPWDQLLPQIPVQQLWFSPCPSQPCPSPAVLGEAAGFHSVGRGAEDSRAVGQGERAGGKVEPQGGSRRGWKGRKERAESTVMIPVSLCPASWGCRGCAGRRWALEVEQDGAPHPAHSRAAGGRKRWEGTIPKTGAQCIQDCKLGGPGEPPLPSHPPLWGSQCQGGERRGGEGGRGPRGAAPGHPSDGRGGRGLAVQALGDVPTLDLAQGSEQGVEGGRLLGGPVGQESPGGRFLLGEGVYEVLFVAQLPGQLPPRLLCGAAQQLLHLLLLAGRQVGVEVPISLGHWEGQSSIKPIPGVPLATQQPPGSSYLVPGCSGWAAAGRAGSGCPPRCRCRCAASPPPEKASGSPGGCWPLACSVCSCSTCRERSREVTASGDIPRAGSRFVALSPLFETAFPREKRFFCSLSLSRMVAGSV